MPYRYIEDIALADIAFEAKGATLPELFIAAADAALNVMVEDLTTVAAKKAYGISLENESLEMLLFDLIQEVIYHKDAQDVLLRFSEVNIAERGGRFVLKAQAYGEPIDRQRHKMITDVKAVTLHRFDLKQMPQGWIATVVLDV